MERQTTAALWIVAGTAAVALSDNVVPILADEMGLWQMLALRSIISLPVAAAFALAVGRGRTLLGRRPGRVLVRSLLVMGALMLYFASLPAVSIAHAAAGMFTSPIWILLVSALFLGERIGPLRIGAVALGFAGVVLVLGIGQVPLRPIMVVPLAAGCLYGLGVIWTRLHCAEESSICLAAWLNGLFLLLGLLGMALLPWFAPLLQAVEGAEFIRQPVNAISGQGWLLLAFVAVASLIGTAFLATGYRTGRSSVVGLFDYSFLLWAPLVAWLMRDEALTPRTAAGMALIACAGVLATLAGRRVERREALGGGT